MCRTRWTTRRSLPGQNGGLSWRSTRSGKSGWILEPWVIRDGSQPHSEQTSAICTGLEGMSDHRRDQELPDVSRSLGERTSASRSWAAWPEAFKTEVVKGILIEIEKDKIKERKEKDHLMAKLTQEQWRQHVMNDHLPYSRECSTCLQGSGRSRPHKKVPHPDSMTLSVDVCGPFRPGHDRKRKAKYFMVGVFSIQVKKVEGMVAALPLALGEKMDEAP